MSAYVCLGSPEAQLTYFESLPSRGDSTNWTINSHAEVGDEVFFYLSAPLSSLVARGIVGSPPVRDDAPDNPWAGYYMADIDDVRRLQRQVHIRELRHRFPEWGWLLSPIRSSRVPEEVLPRLRVLVRKPERAEESGAMPDVDADAISAVEGDRRLEQHLRRERNPALVRRKRASVMAATGRLACEVCGFDFATAYGDLGNGVCEVHHLKALSAAPRAVRTRLDELAVVCSNCHRVIHRTRPMLTIAQLRKRLRATSR